MTTEFPSFSVLICNYNYGAYVGEAIRSALEQDYPPELIQVIVVDDGSTDDSRSVLAQFSKEPRVQVVLQENRGQSAAFEAGVQAATGDYVCLLDSDDRYLPNKLRRVALKLHQLGLETDTAFLCHDLLIEDEAAKKYADNTWFGVVGIHELTDVLRLQDPVRDFPFSIPCGLIFSRNLLTSVMAAMPTWAFPRGTDGVICPAALLQAGCVHYLRETLGVYRIHGGNEFASLVHGRYVPKLNWRERTPRTLRFLYEWLDVLDLPTPKRTVALDYLRRLEHRGRMPSASRQQAQPYVSVCMLSPDSSARDQSALTVSSLQSHTQVDFHHVAMAGQTELASMAKAYAMSNSDYIAFMLPGDSLDREFVERHLYWRHHGTLVGVSCSDVRLVSAKGQWVHADLYRNSGAWKQALQQIPPLATGLKDWVASPRTACLFRRTAFLDRLFESVDQVPLALQNAGFWLAFQLTHHTSGVVRICETLSTHRLPDGAAASYGYLSSPTTSDGAVLRPPVDKAAVWLKALYGQDPSLFQKWLPPSWEQRFENWLAAQLN